MQCGVSSRSTTLLAVVGLLVMAASLPIKSAAQTAQRVPGVLSGLLGDTEMELEGTCSASPVVFEFWSDGSSFASGRDVDGDGIVVHVLVNSSLGKPVGSLTYSRDGKRLYGGSLPFTSFDGKSLSVDAVIGKKSDREGTVAKFDIECEMQD